jgi:hypothetical protein
MKWVQAIMFLVIIQACSPHARQYKYLENREPSGIVSSIRLDNFTCYVREVYRVKDDRQKIKPNPFGEDSTNQRVQFYTLQQTESRHTDEATLIEVAYLFLSSDQFIYVTTVPDVNMRYYQSVRAKNPPEVLNVFDFNTIQVGRVSNNRFAEFDGLRTGESTKWEYQQTPDAVTLLRIIEYKEDHYQAEYSIENGVRQGALFKKINPVQFIFKTPKIKDGAMNVAELRFAKQKSGAYSVFFKFDIRDNPTQKKFASVVFSGAKRVPFKPFIKP